MWLKSALVALAAAALLSGQSARIEVATIKPSDLATCGEYPIIDGRNDRYDMKCVKVRLLLQVAFGVREFQIAGGPAWLGSNQYDIAIKTESASAAPDKDVADLTDTERRTSGERTRQVVRSLLADRFQLKSHRETKTLPVLFLRVSKGGAKLKEISSDVSGGMRAGRGFLAGNHESVSFLARTLSQITAMPIVDQTGLTGKYDFELKWTPDQGTPNDALGDALTARTSADPDRPNIFTAIEEQLGLKLESGKGPVELIAVDHIQAPSPN